MLGEIIIKLRKIHLFSSVCFGENEKSQILFIFDGIFVNAATILTTGVFLSGYIVNLKGSDFLVGVLNNSSIWASIASVFSFLLFERMKRRKRLLLALNAFSRFLICSSVFVPMIFSNRATVLTVVAMMIIIGNVVWGFYNIGITVMMIGLLQNENRSQYIYVRMFWLRVSFTLTTIIMGFVLDLFNKSYTGFVVVFVISLIFSIADVLVLAYVDEPQYRVDKEVKFDSPMFFEPVKDKKYRRFLMFIFLFYLFTTAATSFTPLYQIRYLKLGYGFISSINVITYLLMIACTRFWSRIERCRGVGAVIKFTAVFAVAEVFIYAFLTNNTLYLLFLSSIVSGIGYSGFNAATLTYRYELMPERDKTIYEGWFNAIYGLSTLISPVIGSILMNNVYDVHNAVFKNGRVQLLYLFSALCAGFIVYLMLYRKSKKKVCISKGMGI